MTTSVAKICCDWVSEWVSKWLFRLSTGQNWGIQLKAFMSSVESLMISTFMITTYATVFRNNSISGYLFSKIDWIELLKEQNQLYVDADVVSVC